MTRTMKLTVLVLTIILGLPALSDADTGYSNLFTVDLRTGTAPEAAFTFSPSSPQVGETVRFTDTSSGDPTSWSWNFGDGHTSSSRNPSHSYASTGTYTVILTATNAYGSDSASRSVPISGGGTGPTMVLFDDFTYGCVDGCGDPLRGGLWYVVGDSFVSMDADSGIVELHLPRGAVGKGSGTGNTPQIFSRKSFNGGVYAARVSFDDGPEYFEDPVVEAFWAQSTSTWVDDDRYAEVDFEYLPFDFWNPSFVFRRPTMYMTTWERGNPPLKDDTTFGDERLGGRWTGLLMKVIPGSRVEYSVFDEAGSPIGASPYVLDSAENVPNVESSMHAFFEMWVEKAEEDEDPILLTGDYTMLVDWALVIQDESALGYSWDDIENLVSELSRDEPIDTTINVEEPEGGECVVPDGVETEVEENLEGTEGDSNWFFRIFTGGDKRIAKTTGCEISVEIRDPHNNVAATATVEPGKAVDMVASGPAGLWTLEFLSSGCSGSLTVDYEIFGRASDNGERPAPGLGDAGSHLFVIPAAAHAAGLNGTVWSTDAVIHNPGSDPVTVNSYYLESGQDNSGAGGPSFCLDASSSMKLEDLVSTVFSETSGSGSVIIGADESLMITSRTYNNAADGTYGQYVPGMPVEAALGQGDEARLIQLTRSADYRTNIGFANATGDELRVTVDMRRGNGDRIKQEVYTIEPYGYFQKGDIIGINVPDAYAIVSSSTAGAKYFTYASVVDNHSGDPVLVLPLGSAAAGTDLYVPGAAHVAGAAGTNWRTDLEIHNPGSTRVSYEIALLKKNQANTSPATRSFSLDAGKSIRYEDVVEDLFGFNGSAALRVRPVSGKLMVSARTYNDLPGGTYGQFIPGVTIESAAISEGREGRLIQLSRSADGSRGFRSNIGFVNPGGTHVTVQVEMFDGDGTRLGARSYTLQPYEYDQVADILGSVTGSDVENAYAVLTTTTSGGRFFAYASVVDNRSGDPVYMGADGGGEETPPPPGDEITIALPGGVTMELVYIEPGTFMMGSPRDERGRYSDEDQHQVTLTHGYYLGKYEVTQEQWEAVMGVNPAHNYGVGDNYPVYYVSWNDSCGGATGSDCVADSFIGKLNAYMVQTGQAGAGLCRLPTEAEWEYAARAGTTGPFSFDTPSNLRWDISCGWFPEAKPYMWWCGNADGSTHPVGTKLPNPWELYDMHGNLNEWVADWYTSSLGTGTQTDPTGPASGSYRVNRGGDWHAYSQSCRSAYRYYYSPSYRNYHIGFRLARTSE